MTKSDLRYAGLGRRFLALVADFVLFCAFFFPITYLVKGVWLMVPSDHEWNYGLFITDPLCIAFLIIMVLYFVLLEGLIGTTLGKWIMGLRVVRTDSDKPGLWKSIVRNALRAIDGLALNIVGVVLILSTAEKTRLGDLVAGTRVIRVR